MLFGSKAWYTKRFKTNSLQSFLAREKKKSQKCMKGRGDRPTPPQNTFSEFLGSICFQTLDMVGYGWIWLDTHKIQSNPFVCPCIQTNTTLHICLGQEKKKVRKCMKGGGQAHPSLEYISKICGPGQIWLDTQNSVHLPLQSVTGFNRES